MNAEIRSLNANYSPFSHLSLPSQNCRFLLLLLIAVFPSISRSCYCCCHCLFFFIWAHFGFDTYRFRHILHKERIKYEPKQQQQQQTKNAEKCSLDRSRFTVNNLLHENENTCIVWTMCVWDDLAFIPFLRCILSFIVYFHRHSGAYTVQTIYIHGHCGCFSFAWVFFLNVVVVVVWCKIHFRPRSAKWFLLYCIIIYITMIKIKHDKWQREITLVHCLRVSLFYAPSTLLGG